MGTSESENLLYSKDTVVILIYISMVLLIAHGLSTLSMILSFLVPSTLTIPIPLTTQFDVPLILTPTLNLFSLLYSSFINLDTSKIFNALVSTLPDPHLLQKTPLFLKLHSQTV